MNKIKEMVYHLIDLGFHFRTELLGDKSTGGLIRQIREFETATGVPNWVVLREFGTYCLWLNGKIHEERYSDDVSTINFEDYFAYRRISDTFVELQRITKGGFTYEVIEEFIPIYNSAHQKQNEVFWNKIDTSKGNYEYRCKYRLMGEDVEVNYKFMKNSWTTFDSDILLEMLSKIGKQLNKLNVRYIRPEEFITFVVCSEEAKGKLCEELGINLLDFNVSIEEKLIQNNLEEDEGDEEVKSNEQILKISKREKKWWEIWK